MPFQEWLKKKVSDKTTKNPLAVRFGNSHARKPFGGRGQRAHTFTDIGRPVTTSKNPKKWERSINLNRLKIGTVVFIGVGFNSCRGSGADLKRRNDHARVGRAWRLSLLTEILLELCQTGVVQMRFDWTMVLNRLS